MLNIIQNTIGAIRRVGESVVRAGLKMWLPFTKAEPLGEDLVTNGDFSNNGTLTSSSWGLGWQTPDTDNSNISNGVLNLANNDDGESFDGRAYATNGLDDFLYLGSGKKYVITYTISENTNNATLNFYLGTYTGAQPNTVGTHTVVHTQSGSGLKFIVRNASNNTTIKFSSISLHEYAQETPDISGNDNNAILNTGKALQFTGNDSVETSFPSSYTIKTIAFWIKPTHSSTNETVFYGGGGHSNTRQLYLDHLRLEAINSNISMSTYVNGTFEGVTANGTPATLTQDEWQRVVLTSSTGFTVVSDTFDIASGLYGSDGRFIMSDLQIYNETWTTDDIAYDYANPQKLVTDSEDTSITLDNLKAWWHLSEGDGTVAFDSAPLLGKELVVNGDFAINTGWDLLNATIDDGKATVNVISGAYSYIAKSVSYVDGRTYKLSAKIKGLSGSSGKDIRFQDNSDNTGGLTNSNGRVTLDESLQNVDIIWTANSNSINIVVARDTTTGDYSFEISIVSVKEVYNIDGETYDGSSLGASYVDAQERIPQLGMMNWSKGSNLITYSEDFTEWTVGSNATLTYESDVVAPDGTVGVYRLLLPAQGSTFLQSPTYAAGSGRVFSLWAKKTDNNNTDFNFYDGTTASSTLTATNEWQRFEVNSFTGNQATIINSGDTFISDIYIWGAQVESGTTASAYRRTNGTAVTDATLISSATDSQKDILGNAVRVKGSGFNLDGTGYGEVPHTTDFDFGTGDFSVSAWAKFSYTAKGSSFNAIYTNGGQVDATNTFAIMSLNPNKIVVLVNAEDCRSTTMFSQGEWVHIVATRNSGLVKLYINGNEEDSTSVGNSGNTVTSSQNPKIGYDDNSARFYENVIDDVQVYNRALTSDEIEQNYNATKSGHNN